MDLLSSSKQDERRDAGDFALLSGGEILIGVDPKPTQTPLVLGDGVRDHGSKLKARPAPRRPKLQQHRIRGFQHALLKLVFFELKKSYRQALLPKDEAPSANLRPLL